MDSNRTKPGFEGTIYQKLKSPRHFRLLVLEPGHSNESIKCEIFETSLRDAPAFEALSYVWAQVPGASRISCFTQNSKTRARSLTRRPSSSKTRLRSSSTVAITNNLFAALKTLRRTRAPRILWADQLCINQIDLKERSQQVQIMREIYRKASRVVVWLGDEGDESSGAMEMISVVAKSLGRLSSQSSITYNLNDVGLPSISDSIWVAIAHLFQRPWFRRVWTAQEVIVSRSTILHCGKKQLAWRDLLRCTRELWRQHELLVALLGRLPKHHVHGVHWAPAQVTAIGQVIDGVYSQAARGSCLEILAAFANCEATDPRDKIFSLLGVFPTAEVVSFDAPDYNKNVENVYTEFAKSFVQKFNDASILFYAGACRRVLQVPSWVPDWSTKISTSSFGRAGRYSIQKQENPNDRPRKDLQLSGGTSVEVVPLYHAAGRTVTRMNVIDKLNALVVKGQIFAEITQIGPVFQKNEGRPGLGRSGSDALMSLIKKPSDEMGKWESCFSLAEQCVPQRYACNKDALSACELCLVAGKTKALTKAHADETKLGFKCVKQLAELLDCTKDVPSSTESGEDAEKVAQARSEAEKLVLQISLATSGRLFFLTADRLMGLAPIGCRVRDRICIVYGMSVPFVVREESGGFCLLGECYVQDAMDGEAMWMEPADTQEITLI